MFYIDNQTVVEMLTLSGSKGFAPFLKEDGYVVSADELNAILADLSVAPFGEVTKLISKLKGAKMEITKEEMTNNSEPMENICNTKNIN